MGKEIEYIFAESYVKASKEFSDGIIFSCDCCLRSFSIKDFKNQAQYMCKECLNIDMCKYCININIPKNKLQRKEHKKWHKMKKYIITQKLIDKYSEQESQNSEQETELNLEQMQESEPLMEYFTQD